MVNRILELYKNDDLYEAKKEAMEQLNTIANIYLDAKKTEIAQNLFNRSTVSEDEDVKKK